MVKKNNNTVIIVSVLIAFILLFLVFTNKTETIDTDSPISETTDTDFITAQLYDSNQNPIYPKMNTLSIYNGVPGVDAIKVTITATNKGTLPITCNLMSVTPPFFDMAMTKVQKVVPTTGSKKASWTSDTIKLRDLEGYTHSLSVTMRCSYIQGGELKSLNDKSGTININIQPEGFADFDMNFSQGGIPTEYCGDGYCSGLENMQNCVQDCALFKNTRFRTSDSLYTIGSAIAYTSTCGTILTAYGYESSSCIASTLTTCPTISGISLKLDQSYNIPIGPIWSGSYKGCLYSNNSDSTEMIMLWKSNSTLTCPNQWGSIIYDSDDSDKTKVLTEIISFDEAKEVVC